MKRFLPLLALCLAFALTPARAQHHPPADSAHAVAMERMQRMMEVHERFMADSVYYAHMMADTSMHAAMREMMGPEMASMHEQMATMSHADRMAAMQQMHAQMMERTAEMSPEQLHAFHERMMEAHGRMMADPELKERMMADPEMRQMMERMHEDGMMEHHEKMEHDEDMHERMHDGTDG